MKINWRKYLRNKDEPIDKLDKRFIRIGKVFLALNIIKAIFVYYPVSPIYLLELLWFCNIGSFVLALTLIYIKREYIRKVATFIITIAIPMQGLWILAFILQYTNIHTFNRLSNWNNLLIEHNNLLINIISKAIYILSFMEHAVLIPISIYIIYKLGIERRILIYILAIVLLYNTIAFLISPDNININCMKHICDKNITEMLWSYDIWYFVWNSIVNLLLCAGWYIILLRIFKNNYDKK